MKVNFFQKGLSFENSSIQGEEFSRDNVNY